uniref:Fibronectin type-III domain-containing protein n=1 Tax=Mesocestoides corti TaxID=53468 RepID=A0A5K3G2H0_MESCO
NSIEVYWAELLEPQAVLTGYIVIATKNGEFQGKMCSSTLEAKRCTIYGLEPQTAYTIRVSAFKISKEENLINGEFSPPITIPTGSLIPWLAILLGIFIPLILIILLILAFVYRKKIPFLRDFVCSRTNQDDAMPNNEGEYMNIVGSGKPNTTNDAEYRSAQAALKHRNINRTWPSCRIRTYSNSRSRRSPHLVRSCLCVFFVM